MAVGKVFVSIKDNALLVDYWQYLCFVL
jgi:hypothetical protein